MTDDTTGQPRQNAPEAPFTTPTEAPRPATDPQSDLAAPPAPGTAPSAGAPTPDAEPSAPGSDGTRSPAGAAAADSTDSTTAGDTGGSDTGEAVAGAESDDDDDSGEVAISEPGKVMRIGTMAKQLLEEVRNMELDEAGRARLAEIYRRTIDELSEGMSSELADELKRLNLPFDGESAPTAGELRIAQAQLVGWLEGLFHGIQTAIMAQQAIAQQRGGQAQGALPPGMVVVPQDSEGRAPGNPKDDGHSGTGNYL